MKYGSGIFGNERLLVSTGLAREPVEIVHVMDATEGERARARRADPWLLERHLESEPLQRGVLWAMHARLTGFGRLFVSAPSPGEERHVTRVVLEAMDRGDFLIREAAPRVQAAAPPAAKKEKEPEKEEKVARNTLLSHWVEFTVVDRNGQGMPGMRFELSLPDGKTRKQTADGTGRARAGTEAPGNCELSFPEG